jgi:hypothetical protein
MVTYNNGTHFRSRFADGKREMTISEIRAAFLDDLTARRLDRIEELLSRTANDAEKSARREEIASLARSGVKIPLGRLDDGELVAEQARSRFEGEVGSEPFFWIAASPLRPRRDLIEIESPTILELLNNPPGSRYSGWNMSELSSHTERIPDGLKRGEKSFEYLELHGNGHMEFWTPLNEHFCWGQEEEFKSSPTLYPWPTNEYPATFLRLYRAVLDASAIEGDVLVQLELRNLKGYQLRPYKPQTIGYIFRHGDRVLFPEPHFYDSRRVPHSFNADATAFEFAKALYASFGHRPDQIPFYNEQTGYDFSERR